MPDDKLSSTENQDAKRSARESRLSIRNANKEVLRRELQDLSKVHCVQQIRSFGDCAKREGLMVIFRCRKENKLMNDCMEQYCNEEAFQKFLESKLSIKTE